MINVRRLLSMPNQSQFQFSLKFTGEEASSLDALDLAESIMGTSNMIRTIEKYLYPDKEPAKLNINALEHGSFEILYEMKDTIINMLPIFGATAVSTVTHGQSVVSLLADTFDLYKQLKGGRIKKVTETDDGKIKVEANIEGNNNTIVTNYFALGALNDEHISKFAQKMVAPLNPNGVDSLQLLSNKAPINLLENNEKKYVVAYPKNDINIVSSIEIMTLSIIKIAFEPHLAWSVKNNVKSFSATIADQEFLKRFASREILGLQPGDKLVAKVEIQIIDASSTNYKIIEVIDIKREQINPIA